MKTSGPAGPPATHDAGLFKLEGDFWTVTFEGITLHVRDSKGMHYLAHLVRHPNTPVDVRELIATVGARGVTRRKQARTPRGAKLDRERDRSAVGKRIRSAIAHLNTHHPRLGRFLSTSIRTGYECSYVTDPEHSAPLDR